MLLESYLCNYKFHFNRSKTVPASDFVYPVRINFNNEFKVYSSSIYRRSCSILSTQNQLKTFNSVVISMLFLYLTMIYIPLDYFLCSISFLSPVSTLSFSRNSLILPEKPAPVVLGVFVDLRRCSSFTPFISDLLVESPSLAESPSLHPYSMHSWTVMIGGRDDLLNAILFCRDST